MLLFVQQINSEFSIICILQIYVMYTGKNNIALTALF